MRTTALMAHASGLRENTAGRRNFISARRRAYNREYMRAWRADPRHQVHERATRERSYFGRKLREALRERRRFTNNFGVHVCGFCGKLPSIGEIMRLQIRQTPRGEFVEVLIPYCGQC